MKLLLDLYVKPAFLRKYGYSAGCVKCRGLQYGDSRVAQRSHSLECRNRIRNCVLQDESGREKAEDAELRQNEFLARSIEESDARNEGMQRTRTAIDIETENAKEVSGKKEATSTSSSTTPSTSPPSSSSVAPASAQVPQESVSMDASATGKKKSR